MHSIIKGIPASPGISIGKVYILEKQFGSIAKYELPDSTVIEEVERFKEAILETKEELRAIKEEALEKTGLEHIYIIDTHLMILDDKSLTEETINCIRKEKCNAEWALKQSVGKLTTLFQKMDNEYFKLRKNDIEQVGVKIMRHLMGGHAPDPFDGLEPGMIIVAHDLSPSETIKIKNKKLGGFVTEIGGKTSHTSIFAMSLGVPAVVGCKGILDIIQADDRIIIDGSEGDVCINPIPQQFDQYLRKQQREKYKTDRLQKQPIKPAISLDGKRIFLYANIEAVDDEFGECITKYGIEGVGLFRTEGMYIGSDVLPDEETHFYVYKKLTEMLKGKPAVIRTLDVGGDKLSNLLNIEEERNPAMGQRAIRYSIANQALFKVQLRGILRASVYGKLKIMFPMICHINEIRIAKKLLEEARAELRKEKIPFDADIPIGIMIETPAAALIADVLAKEVDFFSIGTNDLIQYVMAADRCNELISDLYQPLHPAVLKLIKLTIEAANRNNIELSICGEMGGDPLYVSLLMGFGNITSISTEPINIPLIKHAIRNLNSTESVPVAEASLGLCSFEKVTAYVNSQLKVVRELP